MLWGCCSLAPQTSNEAVAEVRHARNDERAVPDGCKSVIARVLCKGRKLVLMAPFHLAPIGKIIVVKYGELLIAKLIVTDRQEDRFWRSWGHEMLSRLASTRGGFCAQRWQQGRSGSAIQGG